MKRSPISRVGVLGLSSFQRLAKPEPKPAKGPKQRKCSNCGTEFIPARIGQKVCGPACAQSFARRITEQQERKADRLRKAALKSRADHLKDAQAAINAYRRELFANEPCISCGRHHTGQYHAGHYMSVGAHPELRFEELNIWKQCQPCNVHLSGNHVEYRKALVARIGVDLVDWLEGPHEPKKYTIDAAKAIKAHYKAKLKALKEVA